MSDLIQSITASIIAVVGFILIIALLFFAVIVLDMDNKAKDDYVKSLNEHDKSVIAGYRASGYHFGFKRRVKGK